MRVNRRCLLLALAVAVVGAAAGCNRADPEPAASTPRELKIGGVFTMTGGTAYWSTQLKRGMDMAIEEANTGGDQPVRLIVEDVQGRAQLAPAAFQKLTQSDGVDVVVSVFTPISQAIRPLAAETKTPLVATVTSVRDFATSAPWVFRDFVTQEQMAAPLGAYAWSRLGHKTAIGLAVDDDYGRDGLKAFRETFEQRGGKWLGEDTFRQTDVNIRAQATQLAARKADAAVVIGRDQSLGLALRQLYEAGFRGQILSVNCLDAPMVWKIAGVAAERAVFASAFVDFDSSPEARQFNDRFRQRHNENADYVNVYGYTIARYLTSLLRSVDGDRERTRAGLEALSTPSLRGHLMTDAVHDVVSPVALFRVTDARKMLLEPPERVQAIAQSTVARR